MDTTFHGKLLHTKVFLEGQEVPCTSVQVSGGIGAPAACNIAIPYADAIHKLAPRTLVHVFTMASSYESGLTARTRTDRLDGDTIRTTDTGVYEDSESAALTANRDNLRNYKLMFVGEVVSYAYDKVGSLRRITLSCQDFSRYWQDAKLYWGRRNTSLHGYKQAIFAGATQLYRGRSRVDSSSDLVNLLRAQPSANKDIPGLLGGLVATLESVTGVFSPDATRTFRGVNDYMSYAELRLHLSRTMGASHKDDSSSTFMGSSSFKRYLRRISRQVKSTASFMDMMNMVLGKCYQQWGSVPCPPLVGGEEIRYEYLKRVSGFNFRNNTDINAIYTATENMYNSLTGVYQRSVETTRSSQDPAIRLDHAYDEVRYRNDGQGNAVVSTENHAAVAADIDTNWERNAHLGATLSASNDSQPLNDLRDDLVHTGGQMTGAAARASRNASAALHYLTGAGHKLYTIRSGSDSLGETHTSENYNAARNDLGRALDLFRRAAGTSYDRRPVTANIRSRLHCFLFHPDIYMMPPPKCNVVFPDQVQSIRFSRSWMSEISRVWLHGRTNSGRDRRNCYFAPNTSILGATLNTENGTYDSDDIAGEAVRKGTGFIMPHEKFTGVISSIVGLGDNDIFKKLHVEGLAEIRRDLAEGGATGADLQAQVAEASSEFMGDAQHSSEPHMARAANYMFFQQRFSARSLSATLRYSPQLVAGMPCLVLDPMRGQRSRFMMGTFGDTLQSSGEGPSTKTNGWTYNPMAEEGSEDFNADARSRGKPRGTHFVGMLHKVTHSINAQGGAQTKIVLNMCREHNEVANIFKDTDGDGRPDAHLVKRSTRTGRPIVPNQNTIHNQNIVRDETFTAAVRGSNDGQLSYDLTASRILGAQWTRGAQYEVSVVRDDTGAPVTTDDAGVELRQNYYIDPVTGIESSQAEGQLAAKVMVRRRYTDSVPKAQNFSFETMARPPWLANVFSPSRIGPEYYQKMMGCGSVMDGNIPIIGGDLDDATSVEVGEGTNTDDSPIQLIKLPFNVGGKTRKNSSGVEEPQHVYIPKDLLETGGSTQQIADQLAEVWLGLKEMGANTNRFIDLYTERSMANIPEVMGTINRSLLVKRATSNGASVLGDAEERIEGFHCWAYGEFTNLQKASMEDSDAVEPIVGSDERLCTTNPASPQRAIDTNIDTRNSRYRKVSAYLQELTEQMGGKTQASRSGSDYE